MNENEKALIKTTADTEGFNLEFETCDDVLPEASLGVSNVLRPTKIALTGSDVNTHSSLRYPGFEHNSLISVRHHASLLCS